MIQCRDQVFVIRPFVADDCREIVAVINRVCAEGRWLYTKRFKPTPAWRRALRQPQFPEHLLLVVEHRCLKQIVGWCNVFPTAHPHEMELGIALLAPYRNRGLGHCLMTLAMQWTEQQNLRRISLTTYRHNQRAIALYRKHGFKPATAQLKQHSIRMVKIL